jgi:8-amino-7-oxononanoate synthase
LLHNLAKSEPDRLIYHFLGSETGVDDQLTLSELDRRSRRVAAKLLAEGLQGSRALMLFPPGLDFIVGLFGAFYAGVVAVPVFLPRKNRTADRVRSVAENAEAACVLTRQDSLSRLGWFVDQATDLGAVPWFATDTPGYHDEISDADMRVGPNDLAVLQYTSGSTGTPRGVMLTHANLLRNARTICTGFAASRTDIAASWLPTYHDMGLVGGVLTPMAMGAETFLMSPMAFLQQPVRWLEMISRHRVTVSGAPNFAYELCLQKITDEDLRGIDLSTWRLAYNGAEPIRASTLDAFARRFEAVGFRREALYACYGMAESTLLITGTKNGRAPRIRSLRRDALERDGRAVLVEDGADEATPAVSCGTPPEGSEVSLRIVDPETKEVCGENRVGEIWVSSPSVGKGYWNRPEDTELTFGATLPGNPGKKYLKTGDLGFLCEGDLYVTGRIKDMIIVRGVNHYPQDIELTVERSDPRLRPGACAAFSITKRDQEHLVVVAEVRRTLGDSQDQLQELFATIRGAISRKHDLAVEAIVLIRNGSIPKTSSGKIQRSECRTAFLDGTLLEFASWQSGGTEGAKHSPHDLAVPTVSSLNAVFEVVRAVARDRVGDLTATTNLVELGLDSLERLEIANRLEQRFGAAFPEDVLASIETCGEVAEAIDQYLVVPPAPENRLVEIPEEHFLIEKFPEYVQLQRTISRLTPTGSANPYFRTHTGIGRDTVVVKGRRCINFSSYNYLGLSGHEHVTQAAKQAIDWHGTSVSASRLVSGQRELHTELERKLASFLGTEDSLVMVSGHATNVTTIGHLVGPGDLILHDALAHNSILQGAQLSGAHRRAFPHNDWQALGRVLSSIRRQYRRVLVAIEGVYSMDGDFPDLPRFIELREEFKFLLLVDEAHSIGTMGPTGRGIGEHFGVQASDVDVWMGTLSKALGSCGGYIAGASTLINYLRYTAPGFVYSVGMPPSNAAAAIAALDVILHNPEVVQRCRDRSQYLLKLANEIGLNTGPSGGTPIVPVIIGNSRRALQVSQSLLERGINVHPILYPAVEEKGARLRFFVTSEHTPDQIQETVNALAEAFSLKEGRSGGKVIVSEKGDRRSVQLPATLPMRAERRRRRAKGN